MNDLDDFDVWIHFDGPEPESIRPLLDALRVTPRPTPACTEEAVRRFTAWLDATPAPSAAPPISEEKREDEALPVGSLATGPTVRTPEPSAGGLSEEPLGWRNDVPAPAPPPVVHPPASLTSKSGTKPSADNDIAQAVASLPFPPLTLEQYASLRAELTVWPEQADAILLRYHVPSQTARQALCEHWEKRFAKNGGERGAYIHALATYIPYLRTTKMAG